MFEIGKIGLAALLLVFSTVVFAAKNNSISKAEAARNAARKNSKAPLVEKENLLITKIKIFQSSKSAPSSSDNLSGIASHSLRNRWCIFTIEFIPKSPGNEKNLWVDEPVLDVRAIFIGQNKGKTANYIFTGNCKFYSLPLDGRRHTVLMMIPPQLLDRYLPAGIGTVGSGTFSVEAVFRDRSSGTIGRGFYYGKNVTSEKQAATIFDQLGAMQPQVVIADSVFHISRTPWRNLRPDDFDLVRNP